MDLIKYVYTISEEFMTISPPIRQHVTISESNIEKLAGLMKEEGIVNFYSKEPQKVEDKDKLRIVIRELIASSINYCYWYGNNNIRPMGVNSNSMYGLVDEAMNFRLNPGTEVTVYDVHEIVHHLIESLSINRYPLLEERARHLLEVNNYGFHFAKDVLIHNGESEIKDENDILESLIRRFQGFASDIFLKRTSLFFIQLHRQLGWFDDLINRLFVPADYQVPKMLRYFNVLSLSNQLNYKIQEGKLIEKGSLMECQIRAATILSCKKLCELTGWNIADIDTWLWTKRKLPQYEKFHLTITTDY